MLKKDVWINKTLHCTILFLHNSWSSLSPWNTVSWSGNIWIWSNYNCCFTTLYFCLKYGCKSLANKPWSQAALSLWFLCLPVRFFFSSSSFPSPSPSASASSYWFTWWEISDISTGRSTYIQMSLDLFLCFKLFSFWFLKDGSVFMIFA